MYTIKQAAARSGVSVPTLRAWERRYGVVRPSRTAAGYRLYGDDAIARLVAMRHLVDSEGWRPSQAAERVLSATDLASLSPAAPPDLRSDDGRLPASTASDIATAAFLAAARGLDVPAMERTLDEAFAEQRFELAMDRAVFPALRAIGTAWSAGEIDVAVEHAASETVRRRLARFFDSTGRGQVVPRVLVGLPPGGQHELGALAFAIAARRASLDVLYLGANVPVESWVRTVRETGARAVVLAVVMAADVMTATAVVEALATVARPPRCLLGGRSAPEIAETRTVTRLPDSLDDAVAATIEAIGRTAGGRR
jgi:methanogenic corrinoid protein MtbC1